MVLQVGQDTVPCCTAQYTMYVIKRVKETSVQNSTSKVSIVFRTNVLAAFLSEIQVFRLQESRFTLHFFPQ